MKKNKISTQSLSGFMELLPAEQIVFNVIKEKIARSFEKFGFAPIDTPIIEKAEVLLAKAGGETEKQIYSFTKGDNDLALRFDLTVPLARYVAEYFNDLVFPFRRYAIGKVYRGERPQKGRFREFYQCDIDIIGDGELSIINDAEIPSIIYATFKNLDFGDFIIKINNRKILNGFFTELGLLEKAIEIMNLIDKLEKIGLEELEKGLADLDIEKDKINKIKEFINISGDNKEKIKKLKNLEIKNEIFEQGVKELEETIKNSLLFGVPEKNIEIDLSIARGLDYYTGTVYETFLVGHEKIGSVCSGGRYDNLAENYTDRKLPGVGISIGLNRLFYQLKENGLLKFGPAVQTKILVVSLVEELDKSLELATKLREKNIPTEVYLEKAKIKKIFSYADKLKIPFVVVIGEDELRGNYYTLKNMTTGEQQQVSFDEILKVFAN